MRLFKGSKTESAEDSQTNADGLSEASKKVSGHLTTAVRRIVRGARWLKACLGIGLALLAGISTVAMDEWKLPLSNSATLVIVALTGVAIFQIYDLLTSQPHIEAVDDARKAVELAREHQQQNQEAYEAIRSFAPIVSKLTSLYFAAMTCRGHVEQTTDLRVDDLVLSIQKMLTSCAFDLRVALDFSAGDYWTVCIYRTEVDGDGRHLVCIADHRAVPCDMKDARRWPEGIGVGGVALARADEVTIPDIYDPSISSAFSAPQARTKDHDRERYRSMCAVPIMVGNNQRPWGVVLATSSNYGHFDALGPGEVDKREALRMLSGFCALLIAVHATIDSAEEALNGHSKGSAASRGKTGEDTHAN